MIVLLMVKHMHIKTVDYIVEIMGKLLKVETYIHLIKVNPTQAELTKEWAEVLPLIVP